MWFAEKFSLNLVEKNAKIFFARKGGEKLWWVLVVVPYIFSNQKSFKIFQMTHKAITPILKICLNIRIAFCFAEASNEMCFWLCGCFQKFHHSFKTAKRGYLINSCTSEVKNLPLFSVFGHVSPCLYKTCHPDMFYWWNIGSIWTLKKLFRVGNAI